MLVRINVFLCILVMIICWEIICWLMGRGVFIGKEINIKVIEYNDGSLYVCYFFGYFILKKIK